MENITDVKCLSCGAPAQYEIKKGCYLCQYCGGKVSVKEAMEQKKGFRQLHQKKMMDTVRRFPLFKASCKSCGAEVVFNENDALAKCAFCGKSLVRKNYMQTNNMPELIIPFKITREEAKERLLDWCNKNRLKAEARRIKETLVFLPERTKLQKEIESNTDLSENVPSEESKASEQSVFNGFYLPYELVKGPVYCSVTRLAEGNEYYCDGYIDEVFVNRSSQMNNLLLDGMEPYKLSELTEFDFAYVAGHQVKIGDINDRELDQRIGDEVAKDYAPAVRKVLESKAVSVDVATKSLMRLPVLLPAYYFFDGDIVAAVNGQTGKVSVQSIRNTHYFFIPWWIKAIFWTIVSLSITVGIMFLCGAKQDLIRATLISLGSITPIIMLAIFSETTRHKLTVVSGKRFFTSKGGAYVRNKGQLVQEKKPLKRKVTPPVFTEEIDGKEQFVVLRFTTFRRIITWIFRAAVFLFLPVIFALFINGFNFQRLNLGGSAVWFCLAVPLIPVFIVKYGILDLYDNPLIYLIKENGKLKRYKRKKKLPPLKEILKSIKDLLSERNLRIIFLVTLLIFGIMVYLTAFGFYEG